jgi:hypothetical protein
MQFGGQTSAESIRERNEYRKQANDYQQQASDLLKNVEMLMREELEEL